MVGSSDCPGETRGRFGIMIQRHLSCQYLLAKAQGPWGLFILFPSLVLHAPAAFRDLICNPCVENEGKESFPLR